MAAEKSTHDFKLTDAPGTFLLYCTACGRESMSLQKAHHLQGKPCPPKVRRTWAALSGKAAAVLAANAEVKA